MLQFSGNQPSTLIDLARCACREVGVPDGRLIALGNQAIIRGRNVREWKGLSLKVLAELLGDRKGRNFPTLQEEEEIDKRAHESCKVRDQHSRSAYCRAFHSRRLD